MLPGRDDLLPILGVTIRFDKWWAIIMILSIAKTAIYMYDCLEQRLKEKSMGQLPSCVCLGVAMATVSRASVMKLFSAP